MLNKNLIRRRISIFLLLTLYIGFCFEAAAFPPNVMAVGELHELDEGYWIEVVEVNVERGEALFVLHKEGSKASKEAGPLNEAFASSGEKFSLDDGDIFHFEATLNAAFRSEDAIMVELTDYEWGLIAAAIPPDVMAVGELHELDEGYGIEVVEANVERGEALFVLYKEGRTINKAFVSHGEWFSLDDRDFFHFEAILNDVSHSEDAIMVELTEYDWWPIEETVPVPEPSYLIFIISAGTILLIFIIFARNRLNDRIHRQKIEEYRTKRDELEKQGYDVSDLNEVLGDEK